MWAGDQEPEFNMAWQLQLRLLPEAMIISRSPFTRPVPSGKADYNADVCAATQHNASFQCSFFTEG